MKSNALIVPAEIEQQRPKGIRDRGVFSDGGCRLLLLPQPSRTRPLTE
jgi:hypothetical protein